MRKIIVSILCAMGLSLIMSSCGCGPTFLYNWRPKPWLYPYEASYTGLDTLINIDGYYFVKNADSSRFTRLVGDTMMEQNYYINYSISFYDDGLCASQSTRFWTYDSLRQRQILDTLYSNMNFTTKFNNDVYKKINSSWGTYIVQNDTIKAHLIENLIGCDGTRKNVITMIFIIKDDDELKMISISNSNKEYGYTKTLDVAAKFYPIRNKRPKEDSPYFKKGWFYKKDKVK